MASISFGGLSSQLDTDTIVETLVSVRTAQQITPLENRVSDITDKQTTLAVFRTYLSNLQDAAETLTTTTVEARGATSSDSALSIGDVADTAARGTYSVTVDTIATVDNVYYEGVVDSDTTTFGTGTFTLDSNGTTTSITIDSTNNTLAGIAAAINDSGANVTASIVNDGTANPYRLVLTSTDTGEDADILTNLASVLTLTTDATLTTANDSVDASITINSLTITQSTNEFTDAIPGLTFTVTDTETATPISVVIDSDYNDFLSAIATFVNKYNTLASAYSDQFSYDEDTESLGVLGSDYALQSSQYGLKNKVFAIHTDLGLSTYKSLSSIGISVDSDGQLSIDADVLQAALDDDPTEVQTLFQGTATKDGFATRVYNYIDGLVNTTDGTFVQKDDIYSELLDQLNAEIEDRQELVDSYEVSLLHKFNYLEEVMAKLNSMQDAIDSFSSQLDSLNTNSSE